MKSLGYTTGALDVTQGEMGTRGTVEGRAEEAREAARILKLDVRENLELPDGHVWLTEETRTRLVRVLRRLKPKVIAHASDRTIRIPTTITSRNCQRIGAARFDAEVRRRFRAGAR